MGFDTHIRRGHSIVFGLIIFFSIIELSISAWLVSRFNLRHNNHNIGEVTATRFLLFTSVWTIVFSTLYVGLFLQNATDSVLTSVLSHALFLFFTWIFWTGGAAAITAELGGGLNCARPSVFVYCGQLNALEGFAWIIWILVTLAIITVIIRGISATKRGDGVRGGLVV